MYCGAFLSLSLNIPTIGKILSIMPIISMKSTTSFIFWFGWTSVFRSDPVYVIL